MISVNSTSLWRSLPRMRTMMEPPRVPLSSLLLCYVPLSLSSSCSIYSPSQERKSQQRRESHYLHRIKLLAGNLSLRISVATILPLRSLLLASKWEDSPLQINNNRKNRRKSSSLQSERNNWKLHKQLTRHQTKPASMSQLRYKSHLPLPLLRSPDSRKDRSSMKEYSPQLSQSQSLRPLNQLTQKPRANHDQYLNTWNNTI